MSKIPCSLCGMYLTEKELEAYPWEMLLTGDPLYCIECRTCPDDCRQDPCNAVSEIAPYAL